jgi:hypothetical protein
MSTRIERLRYYDGEYLRSFDFEAEQSYHIEMRRRLNMGLHLAGIVEGLELVADTESGVTQCSITPGMAIDHEGREIFLFAPHIFGDGDIRSNAITTSGDYDVWIRYRRNSATPPPAGYRLCDMKDQYTRWRESYRIVLTQGAKPVQLDPSSTDPTTEDDAGLQWDIPLGRISVNAGTGDFSIPSAEGRAYIGLRAQRIITPLDTTASFPVLSPNKADTPQCSLGVEANLFAEQNLVVGDDFLVDNDNNKVVPKPNPVAPAVFPNPTGNLKVSNDTFLQGELYLESGGEFLALAEKIRRATPEIVFGRTPVKLVAKNTAESSDHQEIPVTATVLRKPKNAIMTASIASFKWDFKASSGTNPMKISLSASLISLDSDKAIATFNLQWIASPTDLSVPGSPYLPLTELEVSWVVVFLP